MRWMAARKFDAATAERLAERLAEIAYPARMAQIGDFLFDVRARLRAARPG